MSKMNKEKNADSKRVASDKKQKVKAVSKSKRAGASRVVWAKKHGNEDNQAQPTKKETVAKKTVDKKSTDKKTSGKKAADKKTAGKKTAGKKTVGKKTADSKSVGKKRATAAAKDSHATVTVQANGTKYGSSSKTDGSKAKAKKSGAKSAVPMIHFSKNGANNGEQPPRVLAIDIGGTKVKMLLAGELEPRKALSGKEFTPMKLLEVVNELTADWDYNAVTIGFPGLVGPNGPLAEPGNLGPGWVGFDFAGAFQHPVKIINDAAMQAVGSYEGGRMLFVGLGTGFGSTLIVDHVILDVELSELRWNSRRSVGELLSKKTIKKIGIEKWRSAVHDVILSLMRALLADYVVVGGGNAKLLSRLPNGVRVGHNQTAFRGGFRVWGLDSVSSEDLELHGSWKIL